MMQSTKVGFMSPEAKPRFTKPTYQQVCTGQSGHVEVLFIELNKPEEHFEEMIRFFFSFHDPTTLNQQGNDRGFQYASYIFCGDDKQQAIAECVMAELQRLVDAKLVKRFSGKKVTTKIGPLKEFTVAQAEHQEYLANNPNGYCNHFIRIKQWPKLVTDA
jgi:peptide-methionine (S)-S-oxide reductase